MRQEKSWTNEEDKYLQDNYLQMTDKELAHELKRTEKAVGNRRSVLFLLRGGKEYVMYRDDEFIASGTAKEIAAERGIKLSTFYGYINNDLTRFNISEMGE